MATTMMRKLLKGNFDHDEVDMVPDRGKSQPLTQDICAGPGRKGTDREE